MQSFVGRDLLRQLSQRAFLLAGLRGQLEVAGLVASGLVGESL